MVRKFLYFVAFAIVLYLGGRLALTFYPDTLSRWAFVPSGEFKPQPALATNVYDDPKMWISRPGFGAADPARWQPRGAAAIGAPVRAAVFFVHPTSYLDKAAWNAALDDPTSRERAAIFVRGQASPFATSEELWAPRYRQAAFGAFLTDDPQAQLALDLAYRDVLQAFDYFIESTDTSVPIVLAGHSQGALHVKRLLKDRVAGQPLAKRVVAAYVIGWPVSLEHDLAAMGVPPCSAPDQAGCVLSWLSYADPADPSMVRDSYERSTGLDGQPVKGSAFLCTNPLTGKTGGSAPMSANLGTLVPDATLKEGEVKRGAVPAICRSDAFLSIGAPPAMGPYVLPGNDYHVYDIPLFWANVRADFARRVAAWKP
ncbi:MAG: DUF3089 domain-containing protein [Novosphingobium sp.]